MKRVIILDASRQGKPFNDHKEFLRLLESFDYEVVKTFRQNLTGVDKGIFLGQGKCDEIRHYLEASEIDLVLCNFDLTAMQEKNLSEFFKAEVMDRTRVILMIFAKNANSKIARAQVKLAMLNFERTRLVNKHAAYSQVMGGAFQSKGKGEKQINLDRRFLKREIEKAKKELLTAKKERQVNRHKRNDLGLPVIAIAGYTNVGKTSIINELLKRSKGTKSDVLDAYDQYFRTLSTATRLISLNVLPDFFVIDTVGFVANLPRFLLDSFVATLEEIKEADYVFVVFDAREFVAIDVANQEYYPDFETLNERLKVTFDVIARTGFTINAENTFFLANKIDRVNIYFNGQRPLPPPVMKMFFEDEYLSETGDKKEVVMHLVSKKQPDSILSIIQECLSRYLKDEPLLKYYFPKTEYTPYYQKYSLIFKSEQDENYNLVTMKVYQRHLLEMAKYRYFDA
ncbi:MAG: GTPase HflX [Erysipelotrichaceae bacterium]|jgi:GTP-binding protein HflX|nr:GTPase HflX [Erysipelotrichaceae bacterium]